ncbi:MAG: MBL fold metallo-hydrolase [Candidatus Promineofilum sp.]|nr:MBL fold metallo-hydrolase [Promineifilum sp.]
MIKEQIDIDILKERMATKVSDVWRVGGWQLTSGGVFSAYSAEAFLVVGSPNVLIDCGSHLTYDELLRNLSVIGVRPEDIGLVLATHSHGDHIGAAAKLKEVYGIPFAIHPGDAGEAEQGFHDALSPAVFTPPVAVDSLIHDGQEFQVGDRTFSIYHLPGHSPGSVCIGTQSVDGPRLMFVGDVVHGIFSAKAIEERGESIFELMLKWADGLERVRNLDFDYMFEGHVFPFMENLSLMDEDEQHNFVGRLLSEMDSRRKGAENGKELIDTRIFLLRQGFLHLPDYYISEDCLTAGK